MDSYGIRRIRKSLGMTLETLSEMTGVSENSLVRYERGAKAPLRTLYLIASALDVSIADLEYECSDKDVNGQIKEKK